MLSEYPHRRWNPLKEEWILVSPQRGKRPWDGKVDPVPSPELVAHDPECNLCPGNTRKNGKKNPAYDSIFVFDNDFPAVYPGEDRYEEQKLNSIIKSKSEQGVCRVICFSPRHDLTLAGMNERGISKIIDCWSEQYQELINSKDISHVMTFENKGEIMGCSNPHPHGQIWATESIPSMPKKEIEAQEKYYSENGSLMLSDYLNWELKENKRVIIKNDDWVCLLPYWATWPFEVMILPLRSGVQNIPQLSKNEKNSWASIIKDLTSRYDKLFNCSFPYSMGIFQSPKENVKGFTLNQKFFPPLLRSATIKKFMVGYELCAEAQRDLSPEEAALRLKNLN
jgi:UDPglucose--hexose-1-phosphate uridylyltransferase